MKEKHIKARIEQCLAIAACSNCPRRKFGSLLIDPKRNVLLLDAYNGGPRGGGELCGGCFCLRDGIQGDNMFSVKVERKKYNDAFYFVVTCQKQEVSDRFWFQQGAVTNRLEGEEHIERLAIEWRKQFIDDHPPIKSGTEIQIGCHHAEMNVICNAAARGVACTGAWLICTGEPCMMCAKLIHHAGIAKVLVVEGGYMGANGVEYLKQHGVEVEPVAGPKDPRTEGATV